MATQVQWRGGSTAEHATFTGAAREITVDTQKQTLVLHDGSTAGGRPLLREDGSNAALSLGSAGTPSLKFTGDTNTGIYSPGADQVAVSTGGTGRLFVNASGNVQIGSSFAGVANGSGLEIERSTTSALRLTGASGVGCEFFNTGTLASIQTRSTIPFTIQTNELERLRITSAGLVGIGTSTPGSLLTSYPGNVSTLGAKASTGLLIENNGSVGNVSQIGLGYTFSSTNHPIAIAAVTTSGSGSTRADLVFATRDLTTDVAPTERLRIDSSGRLLVGTSTSVENVGGIIQVNGGNATINTFVANSAAYRLYFVKSRSGTFNGKAILQSDDDLGRISFNGDDGVDYASEAASIAAQVDGTPGADDMPGRLVLSTTADGASSPTERMRIKSSGIINFSNAPVYADNAAALAGGLVAGDVYRKADGTLMITF
jgi:hypothetical protein